MYWNAHFIAIRETSTWVVDSGFASSMAAKQFVKETSTTVKNPALLTILKNNKMGMGKIGENIPVWSWTCLLNIG
jgi:orotate phosphoribosyltransferase-like protein